MSLAINVQSNVTMQFYQQVAKEISSQLGDLSFAALRLKNCDLCVNAMGRRLENTICFVTHVF